MDRPHPWLPEAHDLGPTDPYPWLHHPPAWHGPTWWRRARRIWHRLTHPHTNLVNQLDTLGPDPDLVKLHPWDGHVIAVACPACGLWRRDPTTDCPGCGL